MKSRVLILSITMLAMLLAPAALIASPFQIWVTHSPPGPSNNDPATWGGIFRYRFSDNGAPGTSLAGIDRSLVADPAGLEFRVESHELLVGNRHGNTGGGSISRFIYDALADDFIPNGSITGNGLDGVHQLALNPVTGELFAANYGGGVSRFLFDEYGDAVPNGMIGGSEWTRGVAVSPDGGLLYVTSATPVLRTFDLDTGLELSPVSVSGAVKLHYIRLATDQYLYVADPFTSMIYQFAVDEFGALSGQIDIGAPSAVAEALSPDGLEMFATGHLTSHQITRLRWDTGTESWISVDPLYPDVPMGDILSSAVTDMVAVQGPVTAAARLLPNHPNPFNPSTVIPFRLDAAGTIGLTVYDAVGRKIRELAAGAFGPGDHEARWDGTDDGGRAVSTGLYFVRLRAGSTLQARSLVLVR
ncbi:hypothetical protein H8E07_06850 [bacterium]|nr:hypothetical protein [bacterium]